MRNGGLQEIAALFLWDHFSFIHSLDNTAVPLKIAPEALANAVNGGAAKIRRVDQALLFLYL